MRAEGEAEEGGMGNGYSQKQEQQVYSEKRGIGSVSLTSSLSQTWQPTPRFSRTWQPTPFSPEPGNPPKVVHESCY